MTESMVITVEESNKDIFDMKVNNLINDSYVPKHYSTYLFYNLDKNTSELRYVCILESIEWR